MRVRNLVVVAAVAVGIPAAALAASNIVRSAYSESYASNATGIATGDFDGDGTIDAVTTNAGSSNEVNVILGFGDGTLSPVGQIALPSLPSSLALGRFDGDDVDDLVVGLGNDDSIVFLKCRKDQDYFDAPSAGVELGGSPAALAVVDFDGDGKLDIVSGNDGGDATPGSVSFLAGNGVGGFTLVLQDDPSEPGMLIDALPAELGTRAVAVGNIDADANLEVLALNSRANSISIYDGDGHGAFTPGGTLPTANAPQDLRLVDVNGDGKLDLIIANGNEDSVSVRLGNGDRSFAAADVYAVGTAPNRVVVGDLDDNDTLDIATTNSRSGDVTLLRGDGMGGFGQARTFVADAEPQVVALDDFNDDGLLDVITAAQGGGDGGSINLLRNRGDAVLHAVEDVPANNGPTGLAVADVDDDGAADLVSSGDAGEVLVQSSGPDGFVTAHAIDVGGRAIGVIAVDLNGDARPDLAAVDNTNDRVVVAIATATGGFGPLQNYSVSVGPSGITAGDFNNDGRLDIAVSAIGPPGRAAVLLQQANGTFGPSRSTAVQDTPTGIAVLQSDCDANGYQDLIVANQASDTISVLRSLGNGMFEEQQTIQPIDAGGGPVGLAVADFNRDGRDDFAVSDSVTPAGAASVRIFTSATCGGPYTLSASVRAGDLVKAIVARDFTGDGIVDLGVINQTANAMRVLSGNGNGTFGTRAGGAVSVSRMPIAIAAGDLDSDGRYDLVTANSDPSANNLSVAYNCARDADCTPFPVNPPIAGSAALRGDGNNDGIRSAADLVAVGREVMDGDGLPVEQINVVVNGVPLNPNGYAAAPGVDANGDGLVTPQDRRAVARRIFSGA
ncbi:MAG: FG-GAP-like repeat-containing protein [Deltaproteobacteria bacterium]|nr:FG-GAP-like repeat-containing protein [Deltaproteobacteria bacterium]